MTKELEAQDILQRLQRRAIEKKAKKKKTEKLRRAAKARAIERKPGWRPGEHAPKPSSRPLEKLRLAEHAIQHKGYLRRLSKILRGSAGGLAIPTLLEKVTDITLEEQAKRRARRTPGYKGEM
jgi:hypothetical protein